jgi:hypothetical protein
VEEASMTCLASRGGDDSPSRKGCDGAEEEANDDIEANLQQVEASSQPGARPDQFLI